MFATSSYEEIAEVAPNGRKWFQVFLFKDREFMTQLIDRAEKAGFEAIVVTLDGQYFGTRRACLRKPFDFPPHLRLKNVFPDRSDLTYAKIIGLHEYMHPGPTWEDIKWLKSVTKLPVIVKGVMTGEDAALAADVGCDAIWVSNHGGRQLDTLMATVSCVLENHTE
jgi:(S)-2-hydroxy-acid oxidase